MSEQPDNGVPWWRNHPWLGAHLWNDNRSKYPVEELRKYNNMHVAWFPDGSGVRDADPDGVALRERIKASGEDPSWYCYEWISDEPVI
jgi:hypothetical protein